MSSHEQKAEKQKKKKRKHNEYASVVTGKLSLKGGSSGASKASTSKK